MTDQFTVEEIQKLKNSTIIELTHDLEDALIHMARLPDDYSVYDYLKRYFIK
ncbi:hypothetical protein [Paenibacillus pini]|uniref:Uncharacterized protein n=1 Tax=Paenibacillus pini JCM 16418 TaxID=1236976 RepID=W7YQN8_9BACL|nr:hypothetical protein [Paenibacillus pini]GAF10882.1 hypothetical protein JCM16418_5113 [Paenibacillus pini JCM 16418]